MKRDIGEDLLIRYTIGEIDTKEKLEVEKWIKMGDENKKELERIKFIVDNSKLLAAVSPANPEEEWVKFKQLRAHKVHAKVVPISSYTRWLQIAAVLFVICGGWVGYKFISRGNGDLVTFATQEVPQKRVLPDGSIVFLNKHSKITYASTFNKIRNVRLSGEAFFTVIHDATHPFSVQTANVIIKDVGTSFNVSNRGKDVKVLVENGIVEVSAKKTIARLSKGDILVVNPVGDLTEKVKVTDHLHDYYRTGIFSAANTPLSRLVEVLNQAYNTNIVIGKAELGAIPITGDFKMGPINEIFAPIELSTPQLIFRRVKGKIVVDERLPAERN